MIGWFYAYYADCKGDEFDKVSTTNDSTIHNDVPIVPGGKVLEFAKTLETCTSCDNGTCSHYNVNNMISIEQYKLYHLCSYKTMRDMLDKYGVLKSNDQIKTAYWLQQEAEVIRKISIILNILNTHKDYIQNNHNDIQQLYATTKYNKSNISFDILDHQHNHFCTNDFCSNIYKNKLMFIVCCILTLDVLYSELYNLYKSVVQVHLYEYVDYNKMRSHGYDGIYFSNTLFTYDEDRVVSPSRMFVNDTDMCTIVRMLAKNISGDRIVIFKHKKLKE